MKSSATSNIDNTNKKQRWKQLVKNQAIYCKERLKYLNMEHKTERGNGEVQEMHADVLLSLKKIINGNSSTFF